MKLRAQIAIYQEKEAVKVTTKVLLGASETITSAMLKHLQALLLQLAQILCVPLPESDDCTIFSKPTSPVPKAPDWDLVSSVDPTLLQAATKQVEAEAAEKRAYEREQERLKRAEADAERASGTNPESPLGETASRG